MTASSVLRADRASATPAHIVQSDAEALEIVSRLAAEFRTGAQERDQNRILPAAEIEELTRNGIFGVAVPKEFGGAGVSARTIADIFRILSDADPSIARSRRTISAGCRCSPTGSRSRNLLYGRILPATHRQAHFEDTRKRRATMSTSWPRAGAGAYWPQILFHTGDLRPVDTFIGQDGRTTSSCSSSTQAAPA